MGDAPLFETLFHTNRPVESWGAPGTRAVPGWWGEHASAALGTYNVTGPYRKSPNATHKLKAKWNLPQSLKFEWSLATASSDVWLLADTDTVFQCTPHELLERFQSIGAPLVVGTEFWWFPRPHGSRNECVFRSPSSDLWVMPPMLPPCLLCRFPSSDLWVMPSMLPTLPADPWIETVLRRHDPYESACGMHTLKYPNSGLLMGTRAGWTKLVREIRRTPGFPCCRQLPWDQRDGGPGGGECFVDDQACMQAAMLNAMRLGVWARERHGKRRGHSRGRPVGRCAPPPNATTAASWSGPLGTRFHHLGNATRRVVLEADNSAADYALDVHGSLFLNLFMIHQRELLVNERGQLVYRKTGIAPCVIHTNAYKSPTMLDKVIDKWTGVTWVPSNSTRLQRYLMRRLRGEASLLANVSVLRKGKEKVMMIRQAVAVNTTRTWVS